MAVIPPRTGPATCRPFLWRLLLVLSATLSWPADSPARQGPMGTLAVPGFVENFDHPRDILTATLADLRVFVDVKAGEMPYNAIDGELAAEEVREAVRLGLGNWASVLPGMRFRLVDSSSHANLVIRFRNYKEHIPAAATAVAFLPSDWKPSPPAPGAFDFSCGAETFGRTASGGFCRETDNNMILFQNRGMAFRRVHFLDSRTQQDYFEAKTDRQDSSKRYFRFLPDPLYQAYPPNRSTCVAGSPRNGVLPSWDPQCLTDSDWRALPHYEKIGAVIGPYDLGSLTQHEFGHTLLGSHTGEMGGCTAVSGTAFQDFGRDTVYRPSEAIRLASVKVAGGVKFLGYSTLFAGNGLDAAWNSRGLFEADAARLATGNLDYDCTTVGGWKGFPTTYPKASGWIVLQGPDGRTKYVDDWRYAQRLMGWPVNGGPPMASEWFQTGIMAERP